MRSFTARGSVLRDIGMTSTVTETIVQAFSSQRVDGLDLLMANIVLLLVVLIAKELLAAYDSATLRTWGRTLNIFIAGLLFPFALNVVIFFYKIVELGGI